MAPDSQLHSTHYLLQQLSPAVEAVGEENFHQLIISSIASMVPCKEFMVALFADKPQIVFLQQGEKLYEDDLNVYLAGAYLLDPYYRAGVDQKLSGFATYESLAPEGFKESEYYKQYLNKTGLSDECGWLIQFPGGEFINFSMNRGPGEPAFSPVEFELLESITPLITALFHKHWQSQIGNSSQSVSLNHQLDQALQNFAISKLTQRECEVIRLVLQGHSSSSVGERLGISHETVRIHRRNAYKKLDVSSQSELFYLFISSLMRFDNYQGGDPLEGFF